MAKIGHMLPEEEQWIAEVREMRCAECIKNVPFQPEVYTFEQAIKIATMVADEAIKRHRQQWVNTLKAQLKDGKVLIPKGKK